MIDYKDARVTWDMIKNIDWSKVITWDSEGYLSEDLLTLEYDNCIIDVGWYGGRDGHFSIYVITPEDKPDEDGCIYTSESWHRPYMRLPCKDSFDMLTQLQRAIDIYPSMI
jgi:hypothetical protein